MKLFFFIFTCIILYADSFDDKVYKYFSKIKDNNPSSIQNFNNLKMIYLDSILKENDYQQFKILDKLLKSSSIIGLKSSSSYKNEFNRLKKKFNKSDLKYNKNKPPSKVSKSKLKKTKTKTKTKIKAKKSKINKIKSNKLIYIKKQNDRVYLKWTKKLNKSQIKHHVWKNKGYYYDLYDISNAYLDMKTRGVTLKHGYIKIGQYKNGIIRLAYKSKKKRKLAFSLKNKTMQIYFRASNNAKKINRKKINPKKNKAIITEYSIVNKNKSFKNKVIIIDPGHGGRDPGTASGNIKEKDISLKVSKYLISYLKEMGLKAYLTRNRDRFIELKKRTKIANDKKADLFVSIHVNASKNKKVQGIETYFLSPSRSEKSKRVASKENSLGANSLNALSKNVLLNIVNRPKLVQSNKLAIDIQRNLLRTTKINSYNIKDHGVRGGPFWVLVGARMPNVLVELGYLSNKLEAKRLISQKYQRTLAKGIARGIESYLEKN